MRRDLADLLRMGRLPEAWIAPPATRELRELVRHRAKLVGHAQQLQGRRSTRCWPSAASRCSMTDLFGLAGTELLDRLELPSPYAARIASLRRIIDCPGFRDRRCSPGRSGAGWPATPGIVAVQTIPGIGPILGAVFVAEIGDVHRFARAEQLTCWAGLTPKHHESDTHVHRGRITKQGSRLVRWAAIESVQILPKTSVVGPDPGPGRGPSRPQHRRGRRRPPATRVRLLRPARPPGPRAAGHQTGGGMSAPYPNSWPVRVVQVMTPTRGVVAPSD